MTIDKGWKCRKRWRACRSKRPSAWTVMPLLPKVAVHTVPAALVKESSALFAASTSKSRCEYGSFSCTARTSRLLASQRGMLRKSSTQGRSLMSGWLLTSTATKRCVLLCGKARVGSYATCRGCRRAGSVPDFFADPLDLDLPLMSLRKIFRRDTDSDGSNRSESSASGESKSKHDGS